jgi:CDGSH-type Zn-finger protein
MPDAGDPFEIARVVERCPTGALKYSFTHEYLPPEEGDTSTVVVAKSDGPLWLRGAITLVDDQGSTQETRLALCRCGTSDNPPFCDASGPCTAWKPPRPGSGAGAGAQS